MIDQTELGIALRGFAHARSPLVVCDYDGVLAQIVDDPGQAFPVSESVDALHTLASLADTHVAIVTGRSLRDLAALCAFPPQIHLVGSHGAEFDTGFERDIDETQLRLLEQVTHEPTQLEASHDGLIVETKPASVAFHYRNAPQQTGEVALAAVRRGPASRPGVRVKEGKRVIELAVIDTNKGTAVDRLRQRVDADAVLFVGDDVTDEDAFATLNSGDIGIKVGSGPTKARFRVTDTDDTARTLVLLCEMRRACLEADPQPHPSDR